MSCLALISQNTGFPRLGDPFHYLIIAVHFLALWISFQTYGFIACLIKRGKVLTLSGKISLLSAAVV
jgi:hypothetical protein